MKRAKKIVFLLAFSLALFSCSPRILERTHTEKEYIDRVLRDSVYLRDSIFQKEYIKGDTVYLDKYVYKYIYKDRYKTDSVYIAVHDTTTVEKLIEKQLTPIQKVKQNSFWWLVLSLVIALLWIFRKPIKKLIGL